MNNMYNTLQDKFIEVRYLYGIDCFDETRFLNIKNDIKYIRTDLQNTTDKKQQLLIECIDILFQLFKENDRQKIYDFADLIHNMPEIYLGKRSIKSFKCEIRIFNKKYKTKYFNEYIRLFSPKNV